MNIDERLNHEIEDFLKVIAEIDDLCLVSANFGVGTQNKVKVKIKNSKNIEKWKYFCKQCEEQLQSYRIAIKKAFPYMVFLFPREPELLMQSLYEMNSFTGRKYYKIEEPHQDALTIIAKITNLCNIDCQYCYDRPFRECLGHNGIIKIDRIKRLLDLAAKYSKRVSIVWHGGEPTLAGVDFYKELSEYMVKEHPYTTWDQSLQTNGTLLDEEWFELSELYKINFGSSYNATSEDLRQTREDNSLGKEGQTIYNVLDNIKKGGHLGIGVIDVLTKKNHKDVIEIYEFYKREGVSAVFNEILNAGEAEKHDFLFITPEETREYLHTTTEYFKYWMRDKSKECFDDRYASMSIRMLMAGSATACSFAGNCVGYWLCINSNGDLYPCDRALPEKYRFGNVSEFDSLEEVYKGEAFLNYKKERETKKEKCLSCFLHKYCHGACPMEDIDENLTAAVKNPMACKIRLCNIYAAYKAMSEISIDECNSHMKKFLIAKGAILPSEIPALLEKLGIEEKFGKLDFSEKNASFGNKEFKIFSLFNSTYQEDMMDAAWHMRENEYLEKEADEILDDRLERMYIYLKDRATDIIKTFSKR